MADLITPLIAAIFGEPSVAGLDFTINGSAFRYGNFINQLISFATAAAVIFFFVVKPVTMLMERARREPLDESTRACPECLTLIPVEAKRCSACTSSVPAVASA